MGLLLPPAAVADEYDDYRKCLLKVSDEALDAKIAFQTGLAGLITEKDPALGVLANISRDLQVSLARARKFQLDYVIQKDLPRLISASGLTRFMNFGWTRDDEAALQAADQEYAALLGQIETLGRESEANPSWPALRAMFVELQQSKEFRKVLDHLNEDQGKAAKRLEGC